MNLSNCCKAQIIKASSGRRNEQKLTCKACGLIQKFIKPINPIGYNKNPWKNMPKDSIERIVFENDIDMSKLSL